MPFTQKANRQGACSSYFGMIMAVKPPPRAIAIGSDVSCLTVFTSTRVPHLAISWKREPERMWTNHRGDRNNVEYSRCGQLLEEQRPPEPAASLRPVKKRLRHERLRLRPLTSAMKHPGFPGAVWEKVHEKAWNATPDLRLEHVQFACPHLGFRLAAIG